MAAARHDESAVGRVARLPETSDAARREWRRLVRKTYAGVSASVDDGSFEEQAFSLSMCYGYKQSILDMILESVPAPPEPPFLEVGSGYGTLSLLCRVLGYACYGIEPDRESLELSQARTAELDDRWSPFLQGAGECLPFRDARFGMVLLDNVLEHVQGVDRVISEACRVLRPGGYLYLVAPNYAAFRKEAHYGLPWAPLLPRWLARMYVRRYRGNTAFLDTLNYTTSWGIRRLVERHRYKFIWPTLVKLSRPELCRDRTKRLLLSRSRDLGLTWVLEFAERLRLYNPCIRRIEILAQKPERGLG